MPEWTSEVGLAPPTLGATFVEANSYNVGIDTAKGVSLPAGVIPPSKGGVLECYISIEGTQLSRYRWDGVAPTATVGIAIPAPVAGTPVQIVLVGQRLINAFQIIGAVAGNTMSYTFAWRDNG
jgi:hypothetical protein